ncbi:MAG TPA: DNA mismatch repair endonuclease MutL [Candidatus Dormibacteraeota bacterium]|nr:DNA mismatch repair endonuclease MutL [Candidatus Dormibacteraeota bacterium]
MPRPEAEAAAARIAVLPPEVADGIAAGEVVERPAAVVKELVENSIDAGASRLEIRIEGAGQQLIEVVDDGVGMSPADLRLAFHRHATSKLRSLDELGNLRTLGFRGEALASIGAVARVEATSRLRDGGEGYRVVVEGGITIVSRTSGSPPGTRVSVSRLFFNTPARLKFLRQAATETAVMARIAAELALGNPSIAFSLDLDRRRVLETPGTGDLRTAFAAVYDSETAEAMLSIDEPAVHGLISPPALHRGTRDHIVILVNGRRIHHRNLAFAVEQAYRGLREPDRFPLAALNLLVDPLEVDVNVHPTKREVRFRNEGAMFATLERACFRALRQSPIYELQPAERGPVLELRETAVLSSDYHSAVPQRGTDTEPVEGSPALASSRLPPLTYVGQLLQGYLVAEAPGAIVLVDQHAAHERVLFDRILRRLQDHAPGSQMLLVPHLLDLTPAQLTAFRQHESWLRSLGFEAEPFGPHTIRLLATPSDMPESRADRVLELVLADLAGERTPDRRVRESAALIACHSAVRFGDRLDPKAAGQLLSSLAMTDEPISCPHGRPTALVLADEQLRRLFKRP